MGRPNLATNPYVRCGRDSEMVCPRKDRFADLLDELYDAGYEAHFDEIDARVACSAMSRCTNCNARGRFTYAGVRREPSYRAFWSCRACGHWIEV